MIEERIRKLAKSYGNYKYHLGHRKSALDILKNIEAEKGKTNTKLIKLSDEYASDVLGSKIFAPWLYVYSAFNQNFKEGWIPDNYYGKVIAPKLQGTYGLIAEYNALTSILFKDSYFFPNLFYFANGLFLSTENQFLSESEIKEIAFKDSERVVYKIDVSLQGKGVFFFDKNNFDIRKIRFYGNGVLQSYIKQHSFFNEIMSNSVATIRITSVVDDLGKVSIRAAYLRIGRNSDTHVKSATNIKIPVFIENGRLHQYGYTTSWRKLHEHPDTGFVFENEHIPGFDKCCEVVVNLHEKVPFTRIIGWDIIIDVNDEVKIMEWNGYHNDIKFSEATMGPCFSDMGWEKLWRQ